MRIAIALGALAVLTALADGGSARHRESRMREIAEQAASDAANSRDADDSDKIEALENRVSTLEEQDFGKNDAPAPQ